MNESFNNAKRDAPTAQQPDSEAVQMTPKRGAKDDPNLKDGQAP
jgi:hypothetical protein